MDAAFALANGTAFEQEVTLTGVVLASTYNPKKNNANVYFIVDGMVDLPMYAYGAMGEGIEALKAGYTVTVTGIIKNYNGLVEFDKPQVTAIVEGTEEDLPATSFATVADVINAAYELEPGRALGGLFTMTGVVVGYTYNTLYGDANVTISVEGCEDKPMYCYQAKGQEAGNIQIGDTITVKGMIKNHQGTVELDNPRILSRVEGSLDDLPAETDPATILNAAYALAEGESLIGVYKLTGTITRYEFNPEFGDAGIVIVVEGFEDMPMFCFQTKGVGVENLKVGDVITVTATVIKNYMGTIEFDKPGFTKVS
jgi:RecG-like helicase